MHAVTSLSSSGSQWLVPIAHELHDKAQLLLPQQWFDLAHDAQLAANLQPLADLERLLAAQMTSRDDLVTAPQLIAIGNPGHRPPGRYAPAVTVSDRTAISGR
jgi:hypothetical protein